MVFDFRCVLSSTNQGRVKLLGFYSKLSKLYLSQMFRLILYKFITFVVPTFCYNISKTCHLVKITKICL